MCGIVAVVSRPSSRACPTAGEVLAAIDRSVEATGGHELYSSASVVAEGAEAADALLRGVPGVQALVGHPELVAAVLARVDQLDAHAGAIERAIEAAPADLDVEAANAGLVRLRDVLWALRNDRLRTAREVAALAGRDAAPSALAGFTNVQVVLSALDRLEVRGRDSAGLHLFVWGHGLDLTSEPVRHLLTGRFDDALFTSGAVRVVDGVLSFVYKAAAEIGELGDNTRALRAAMASDRLLHLALAGPGARIGVLAHTRWASVGIVSEPNAHPLNQEELDTPTGAYVVGALNGDVDNHADLKVEFGLRIAGPITTDAKVIPAIVSRHAATSLSMTEAFRRTVSSFDGSVAIGVACASDPEMIYLAQRGSGQALYVGLADDAFVVASEPYGLVEETARYVRLDGETPLRADDPNSRGQIFVLDGRLAGDLAGVRRLAYDGTDLPMSAADVACAEVTTRDIDRGSAPHFLLKEISEAPNSFRKTLRGHIREGADGLLSSSIGERALPVSIAARLAAGSIGRVEVIGQGTAAIAGQAMADLLPRLLGTAPITVRAITATEYSGFAMAGDLSDTLVVAVSQSGTTTDTNRTVDLARERGAAVIGIVNRRGSDLTEKAHGVLHTSDGRDVEMSVASTKAFYAQVAAGALLACAIAEAAGAGDRRQRSELLAALRTIPDAMTSVLALRPQIRAAAHSFAPSRRSWAVVGNGPNRVAAEEVRIKLSELCYKSIACDVTEDKKHIDLSSEPMILVCAAGLMGGTADDVAKEVAIYRAHKAAPIVIATEGEERFNAALQVIAVPAVDHRLAFILSAMVGHLFGYEAALAIDALARPLREAREVIEQATLRVEPGEDLVEGLRAGLVPVTHRFADALRTGSYNGSLEASTAVQLMLLLRDATSAAPLEAYQATHGKVVTPGVLVDDLLAALTRAIEELTRPVDAIKHQAKTVTVGISRSDESLLGNRLVREVLSSGAGRDRLSYRVLKELVALDPAIEVVTGFTRYSVEGDPEGSATIAVVDRGGLSRDVPSRVDRNPELRGTKRRVAAEREVLVARGRNDGRAVLLVPEVKGNTTTGITLLHIRFVPRLDAGVARTVLAGYRNRFRLLADWVSETESTFREDLLATIDTVDLLTLPVTDLADLWRS